jgi:hypothetical protein
MPFLTAKAFDLTDGHAFDPDIVEAIFHLLEFEWLDDGFYPLHTLWFLD